MKKSRRSVTRRVEDVEEAHTACAELSYKELQSVKKSRRSVTPRVEDVFIESSNCALRQGDSGSDHNVVILLKTGPQKGPEKGAPRRRCHAFYFQLLRRGVHQAAQREIHTELLPRVT